MWISVRVNGRMKEIAGKVAKLRGKSQSATVRDLLIEEAIRVGIPIPGEIEA